MRIIKRLLIVLLSPPLFVWALWYGYAVQSYFCWTKMRYLDPKELCPIKMRDLSEEWRSKLSCEASWSQVAAFQVFLDAVDNDPIYSNMITFYDACGKKINVH